MVMHTHAILNKFALLSRIFLLRLRENIPTLGKNYSPVRAKSNLALDDVTAHLASTSCINIHTMIQKEISRQLARDSNLVHFMNRDTITAITIIIEMINSIILAHFSNCLRKTIDLRLFSLNLLASSLL